MIARSQTFSSAKAVPTTLAAPAVATPSFSFSRRRLYRLVVKRALDITLIILALPVALPLVALMALLAALDGASPFYRQERVGRDGRIFQLLKIRTMVPDADAQMAAYLAANPEAKREWDETQKLKHDPRITRVGDMLRKTSLDELPQLWNVLRGDMSIVGPRPMMVDQQPLYPGRAYYRLRPGITGPWQVSDRNNGTFAGRAKFDTAYYRDLSLATDLSILLRTVSVVIRRTGY
jgi:exopolysaccharide production protein ExoY